MLHHSLYGICSKFFIISIISSSPTLNIHENIDLMNLYALNEIWLNIIPIPLGKSTINSNPSQGKRHVTDKYWYWICIAALLELSLLFNMLLLASYTLLNHSDYFAFLNMVFPMAMISMC